MKSSLNTEKILNSLYLFLFLKDQRITDINYWKKELEDKLNDVYNEIDSSEVYKKRIEKQLEFLQEPLHIAQTCLANR